MTDEVIDQTIEDTSEMQKQLQDSLLAVPGIVSKQDEILSAVSKLTDGFGSLTKRIDDIEKGTSKKEDDEEDDDKVEINIEDDKDDKEEVEKKTKKSNDFEARLAKVEAGIVAKTTAPAVKEPTIEKTDSVEPTAPPAADRPIVKEETSVGYLQGAANEINKFGSWRKFAEEKKNENTLRKMKEDVAMYEGMEQSRKELEAVQVNTIAPPVNEIKRGNGGFLN